jgi:hypothetical protein
MKYFFASFQYNTQKNHGFIVARRQLKKRSNKEFDVILQMDRRNTGNENEEEE